MNFRGLACGVRDIADFTHVKFYFVSIGPVLSNMPIFPQSPLYNSVTHGLPCMGKGRHLPLPGVEAGKLRGSRLGLLSRLILDVIDSWRILTAKFWTILGVCFKLSASGAPWLSDQGSAPEPHGGSAVIVVRNTIAVLMRYTHWKLLSIIT